MNKKSKFSLYVFTLVLVFFYIPLLILIIYSFNNGKSMVWQGFSLKWYKVLFFESGDDLWVAFLNSIKIAISASVIATAIGTMGAIGIYWYNFKLKKYLQIVTYVPLIIPEIIVGVAMIILFAGIDINIHIFKTAANIDYSFTNYFLNCSLQIATDFIHVKLAMPLSLFTIFLAHVTFCIPFVIFIIMSRLEEFDYSIIEAAYDLGATEIDVLFKIIIPIIKPGIIAGLLMAVTLSIDDFVITSFVMGPGSATLPIYICNTIKRGSTQVLNSLSVLLILMSLFIAVLSVKFKKYMFK